MGVKSPAGNGSFDHIFDGGLIPSLNGWRAVAILLVLIEHSYLTRGFPPRLFSVENSSAYCFQKLGLLGVRLFFVLSGFLITHLLLREAEKSGAISMKAFYIRRILRIFPVYFTYLGVLGILCLLGVYHDSLSSWLGVLTFTRNVFGHAPSLTVHFWSLAIEEQFYLFWPALIVVLLLWLREKTAIGVLLIPLLLCPIIRMAGNNLANNEFVAYRIFGEWSILSYADSLAAGCLGAFLIRKVVYRLKSFHAMLLFVAALVVIVLGECCKWTGCLKNGIIDSFIPTIQALAMMLTIWVSIFNKTGLAYRILNWSLMERVGMLSYSIYVWHFLFLSVNAGPKLSQMFLYDWRIWWLAALPSAIISYYCIEQPVLRLKKQFTK